LPRRQRASAVVDTTKAEKAALISGTEPALAARR
jgi:hypothetical protein